MLLQTKIPFKKQFKHQINYQSKLVLIGSCFSENIGEKLNYFKFQSLQNPFGILFHPKAIETFITNTVNKKEYTNADLVFQNERWHCFDAHSVVSSVDKNDILKTLNSEITATQKSLKEASHIIITLGTSWVYRFIETNKIVANCHKIPQKYFTKKILSIDEITNSLKNSISHLKSINTDVKIIFTISPVRHLKDGFIENMQSKSHLIAAIHQITSTENIHYFPSFEIMMDELRDYRFYTEDMLHPNKTAINYIWEKFTEVWFSVDSKITMQEIDTIQKGIAHKPFSKLSESHQQFLATLIEKKKKIQLQFSFIKF